MPLVLLTDGYGSESFKQVEEIINFVRRSDRVRIRYASSLKTGKAIPVYVNDAHQPSWIITHHVFFLSSGEWEDYSLSRLFFDLLRSLHADVPLS